MILSDLIDFDILRIIWWLLLGVLLVAFAVTDGFDMGVGTLLPFVAKTDSERRVTINTIGPIWEGNQVWFVLGGGAIFAAWPPLYAVSFSGFYLAMFAVLAALILRPVAFKYRSKRESRTWRACWDWALFIGGTVPALIFGVAMGNVLQGVPFRLSDDLVSFYEGSFFGLLNPFAILCGVVSVAMTVMHGASWLNLKTEGVVQHRARAIGAVAALVMILAYALAGVWLALGMQGYAFAGTVVTGGPSNPLLFDVVRSPSWFSAYGVRPWIAVAPVAGFAGALLAFLGLRAGREGSTMIVSGVAIAGVIASVGLTMFPFILPSVIDPRSSLAVWNASSSHLTLFVMLISAVIFVPLIIAYTTWVYKVLWGKVTEEDIKRSSDSVY